MTDEQEKQPMIGAGVELTTNFQVTVKATPSLAATRRSVLAQKFNLTLEEATDLKMGATIQLGNFSAGKLLDEGLIEIIKEGDDHGKHS